MIHFIHNFQHERFLVLNIQKFNGWDIERTSQETNLTSPIALIDTNCYGKATVIEKLVGFYDANGDL